MYRKKIIDFTDKNKSFIWGLFLATIIFKFAVANVFLGILILIFIIQFGQSRKINFQKSLFPLLVYFFWGLLSFIWTTDLLKTIKGIEATAPFIVIPILISQYSDFEINDLTKTIKFFSTVLLLYFFICLVNASLFFLNDGQINHFFYHKLTSVNDNNAIYISLAVAICILINFNLSIKAIKDYLIILLLGLFLLLLSSKNIIITTFSLIVLSMFLNKKNLKNTALSFLTPLLFFLCISLHDNPIKERFLKELNINLNFVLQGQDFYNYNFSGFEVRLFQWRIMNEMIVNNQVGLLGLGLNNVNYLIEQYFNYYNLYKGYFHLNFHNQYFQTIGELGFIGLLLLLVIYFMSFYYALIKNNIYKIVIIILFFSAFFTESFLSRQKGVFLFVTIFSIMHKVTEHKKLK